MDESRSPVLVTTWRGSVSADVMREYLAWLLQTVRQARKRGRVVGIVHNAVDVSSLEAPTRRVVAEWRAANPTVHEVLVGNWIVSNNRLSAGTLVVLGWFYPEARTIHFAPTLDEAVRRAAAALDAAMPTAPGSASTSVGNHLR